MYQNNVRNVGLNQICFIVMKSFSKSLIYESLICLLKKDKHKIHFSEHNFVLVNGKPVRSYKYGLFYKFC